MKPDWKRTCAIWQGRKRVASVDAAEIETEGRIAKCEVQFKIWRFLTPGVLDPDKYSQPMAFVRYVLTDRVPPPNWPMGEADRPWAFILARLCAPDAVITGEPLAKTGGDASAPDKIVGRNIFAKDSRRPFTDARDGSLDFADQDRGQVECECYVDILCALEEADRDRCVQVRCDPKGLLESGMLGNFYQDTEVFRALQRAVESRMVCEDGELAITEAGRDKVRRLFEEEGFERRLAPSLRSQKPRIGFGG